MHDIPVANASDDRIQEYGNVNKQLMYKFYTLFSTKCLIN